MTTDEFARLAAAILGTVIGWQGKIARRLGVNARTVRRWVSGNDIPAWAATKLEDLIGLKDNAPWPRDEWILGDGFDPLNRDTSNSREYIVHAGPPRFIARVVACDDDGMPEASERPADLLTGAVHASGAMALCEVVWIDDPDPGEVGHLLEAAADVVEQDC